MTSFARTAVLAACLFAAPAWAAPSKSHVAAAEELLQTMQMEKVLADSMDTMLKMQLQQNPGLQPFDQVMREFMGKHMSWAALKDDFVIIYAEAFTESELKTLTAFYKTPVGQKSVLKMPELMQKGAELGQRRVEDNMAELQTMIQKRAEELYPAPQ